ncbi:hypothetical protein HQ520_09640 [bacterium]|nr:hypothetical protein [bacterium]
MREAPCNLEWLVDHELKTAKRYRRFLSLMILEPPENTVAATRPVTGILRETDVYFSFPNGLVVLVMSETDPDGARSTLARCKRIGALPPETRYGLASFPDDNLNSREFLATGFHRLQDSAMQPWKMSLQDLLILDEEPKTQPGQTTRDDLNP